jgi:hypothetical protein
MTPTVFKLEKITDHPLFEGFGMDDAPSILGRENLVEDLTPGFGAAEGTRRWAAVHLAGAWRAPRVRGRVTEMNDYPCVDLVFPAFSARASDALRDLLEPHGELLPLDSDRGDYHLFNVTRIVDGLDAARSVCEFWSDPPTTAIDIERYAFRAEVVSDLPIFRVYEDPMTTLVTEPFVARVRERGLQGFLFHRLWPLPDGQPWWALAKENRKAHAAPELQRHSLALIVVWPDSPSDTERAALTAFEDALDARLAVTTRSDPYYGTYRERADDPGEVRLLLSAPDADRLFEHLEPWLRSRHWPASVRVLLRQGPIHDEDAREREVVVVTEGG